MQHDVLDLLRQNELQLLDNWLAKQAAANGLAEQPDLRRPSEDLLRTLFQSLAADTTLLADSPALQPVLDRLMGIADARARQGYSSRDTGQYILGLKEAMLEVLQTGITADYQQLFTETVALCRLFDRLVLVGFETFIAGREAVILRQTDEIAEVSTPVIQVWDGILVLPIIGTLDSARTQMVMENLLQAIVDTSSSLAVLDISGVPAVDSLIAQHLIKTVSATRLMGAECIISGIRPEIAQTVVHLGIDLSNIITKATLASALKYAFSVLQLDVRRTGKPTPTVLL